MKPIDLLCIPVKASQAVIGSSISYNQPVDERTVETLNALNRQFYQTLAEQFSATRQRLQPGVHRLMPSILKSTHILDLGCGNGELARQLSRHGFQGTYTGLDFSLSLLKEARQVHSQERSYQFLEADLTNPKWELLLSVTPKHYDCILAFASLHHIPGRQLRVQLLQQARRLISPNGKLIHSEWMFMNSPRLRSRIQPWEVADLHSDRVEAGDYLLDWKSGGYGLRYVHHFTAPELDGLALETGFRVKQSFLSDGNGNKLSNYQIWLPTGEVEGSR